MPDDATIYYETEVEQQEPEKKKSFLRYWGDRYKDYKSKAPERRQQEMQKLREENELWKLREQVTTRKNRVSMGRMKMAERRRKLSSGMPSMFGSSRPTSKSMPRPSLWTPAPGMGFSTPKKKRKKRRIKIIEL